MGECISRIPYYSDFTFRLSDSTTKARYTYARESSTCVLSTLTPYSIVVNSFGTDSVRSEDVKSVVDSVKSCFGTVNLVVFKLDVEVWSFSSVLKKELLILLEVQKVVDLE